MNRLIFALLLACLFLQCGPSSKEQVLTRIAEVKQAMHNLESQAPGDHNTNLFLAECESELLKINGLLVEDEAERGLELLNMLAEEVARFDPHSLGDENAAIAIGGTVEYKRPGQVEYSNLTPGIDPAQIQWLRTGIRSAAEVQLVSGLRLRLADQTELEIGGSTAGLSIHLNRGVAWLSQAGAGRNRITVDLFQGNLVGETELTVAWLSTARYLSVFRGALNWQELASEGRLDAQKGLIWTADGARKEIDIPSPPGLQQPVAQGNQTTFYWTKTGNETFQIQVSQNRLFSVRELDKSGIHTSKQAVTLSPGDYFWRVRSLSPEFVPGGWSKVHPYRVLKGGPQLGARAEAKRAGPPLKKVNLEVISDMVIVTGFSEANARVTANGNTAFLDGDGSFRVIINFTTSGTHHVQVVAVDEETGAETIKTYDVEIAIH